MPSFCFGRDGSEPSRPNSCTGVFPSQEHTRDREIGHQDTSSGRGDRPNSSQSRSRSARSGPGREAAKRSLIIWDKGRIVIGRGHYHWRHEACWYAVKKGAQAHWKGGRKASTLWEIDNPRKSETGHSAQKPVECMQRAIHNHRGDVYDPFVGSGTTVIAGEQEGRTVYALEIEPAYVDVTVRRWEDFTGQKSIQVTTP